MAPVSSLTRLILLTALVAQGTVTARIVDDDLKMKNWKAEALSSTEIEVTWDGSENNIPGHVGYYFYYRGPLENGRESMPPSATNHTLRKLEPDTNYKIMITSFNNKREERKSEIIHVKTLNPDELKMKNWKAVAFSSTEIEVTWDGSENNIPGHVGYYFYYRGPLENGKESMPPSATKYTLRKLEPDTNYKIMITSFNNKREERKSAIIHVKTLKHIPSAPKHILVESINSTTILVQWGIVDRADGYIIYYTQLNDDGEPGSMGENSKNVKNRYHTYETLIMGLQQGTRYSVAVAAYSEDTEGHRSETREVKTESLAPSLPRNQSVETLHNSPPTMYVSWTEPEVTHKEVTGYRMHWGPKDGDTQQVDMPPCRSGFATPFLEWNTTYVFSVMAGNEYGYGAAAVVEMETPSVANHPQKCSDVLVITGGYGHGAEYDEDNITTSTPSPTTITEEPDNYQCRDRGVAGNTCQYLVTEFFKTPGRLCRKYFTECCEMCSARYGRRERGVRTLSGSFACKDLVVKYGWQTTCTMYTRECFLTCGGKGRQ